MQQQATLVYVPAVHAGIVSYISETKGDIWVLGSEVITLIDAQFDYLRKEIRALTPKQAVISLSALFLKRTVKELTLADLISLNAKKTDLVLPREDIFYWLAKTHLTKAKLTFSPTFLRWNRDNSTQKTTLNTPMATAFEAANQSSDWWRQVGCALVKNGKIISTAFNHHLPSPYTPYIDSDPRNSFHKGEHIELSTAIHAEAALIADAAKKGISLEKSELYVSTFPCPACAKLIACSGIKKLYFSDGYSVLDGETILEKAGISLIRLK